MIFFRIIGNKLFSAGEVNQLGFPEDDASYIPDEYLQNGEFVVCRTAFGFGDWSIISAMPRLLKEKYPNCKVTVPTKDWFEDVFGDMKRNWPSWSDPYNMGHVVFDNNPYVDEYAYPTKGDIFHDHYRIYNQIDTPLVKQMLKFWQFEGDEMVDAQPEMYWSDQEKQLGDEIIQAGVGDNEFGGLLISNRHDDADIQLIDKLLMDNEMPYFYLAPTDIQDGNFDYVNPAMDLRHVDIRIQLYIRSKAKLNIGNQCGVLDTLPRYTDVYSVQRQYPLGGNFIDGEIYLKKGKE